MILLAASLFFTEPAPLEMPRAEAYLVEEKKTRRLEDRFNEFDLWISRTVDGRWIDNDGRVFIHSTISFAAPPENSTNAVMTRAAYEKTLKPIDRRDEKTRLAAFAMLSPIPLAEKGKPPRQLPHWYKDVDYFEGTNTSAIVCAYLPRDSKVWRFVTWELIEGDDYEEAKKFFEEKFLRKEVEPYLEEPTEKAEVKKSERELLRRDARHSVAKYSAWHTTDSEEFSIIDDLSESRAFINVLTNDLKMMRAKYAETVPTGIDGSNTLAVARIYASRDEYLDALEACEITNMNWSAAYWTSERRELVAYLPPQGENELLKTIRHEAFHQYLAYASSMIPVSPWLNEGYAQYFEGDKAPEWTLEERKRLKVYIPQLLAMDYAGFYSGTDEQRQLNYQLAHSLVEFLEKGAPEIRFDPFKNFKRDYFEALFQTHDMRRATSAAFASEDKLKLFLTEWTKGLPSSR